MKTKSLSFNYIMNGILTMSSFIFPLITFPYVTRVLMPDGLGRVSFATSIISYFSLFAQLGIPTYGIRACARVRDDREKLTRTVHELLAINLVTCLLSYIVLFFAIVSIPRLREEYTLFFLISATILLTSIGMEWLYKALEQYTYITIRSLIFKIIAIIAMLLLIKEKDDYIIYGGISIFAASASNILNFINVRKFIDLKFVGNYNIGQHLSAIMIFFSMACATTIYTHMDTAMLGFMKTDADVGYYSAAIKVKQVLVSVVTSLGSVLLPRASFYIQQNKMKEFHDITQKAVNFVFIIGIPLMLFFTIYAQECIYILSGKEYEQSIFPMQILMPTVVLIGVTNVLGIQILLPLGKEKIVLYSEIAGAISNLIINIWLIPQYAVIGAAIGTLVAETVVLIVQCIALRKELGLLFSRVQYYKIIVAVGCGFAGVPISKAFGLGDFITMTIGAIVCFGIYGVVLLLCNEQLTIEVIRKLRRK